ncbi:MAG TPA: hypothetical protein VMU39_00420 [Solirubrobacteraceae bacterium]|nr:hypothetical protein [Solirubrobacteraceae bacterium]
MFARIPDGLLAHSIASTLLLRNGEQLHDVDPAHADHYFSDVYA